MSEPMVFNGLPRGRPSAPAQLVTGLVHLALLWALLQSPPVERAARQVVYQLLQPVPRPVIRPPIPEAPPPPALKIAPVQPPAPQPVAPRAAITPPAVPPPEPVVPVAPKPPPPRTPEVKPPVQAEPVEPP